MRLKPKVARFSRYKDKQLVKHAAPRKLRGKPFGINGRYPKESLALVAGQNVLVYYIILSLRGIRSY